MVYDLLEMLLILLVWLLILAFSAVCYYEGQKQESQKWKVVSFVIVVAALVWSLAWAYIYFGFTGSNLEIFGDKPSHNEGRAVAWFSYSLAIATITGPIVWRTLNRYLASYLKK